MPDPSNLHLFLHMGVVLYTLSISYTMLSALDHKLVWPVWTSVLLMSPLMIFVLGVFAEARMPGELITLKGSWALMFGDPFLLAPAVGVLAAGLRRLDTPGWAWQNRYVVIAGLVGFAGGAGFHYIDGNDYRVNGFADLVNAATKWAHDYATFSFILALIAYLLFLLAASRNPKKEGPNYKRRTALATTALLLAWMAVYARDATAGLDREVLHGGAAPLSSSALTFTLCILAGVAVIFRAATRDAIYRRSCGF